MPVVIEDGDTEAFRSGIAEASLLRGVFKLVPAQVVPQPHRRSLVRLRRAITFVRAVERAIEVGLLGPPHVVRDYKVEFAVAVVVYPGGAGREFIGSPHAGGLGDVGEGAVAVVVEEMTLP